MIPAVSSRLLELTRELNNDIKIAAIYALGEGGSAIPAITSRLIELSQDLNVDVKIAATKALGRVSRKG
ncbi:HEAT repeat domain-containing protein [Pantoea piersonii]|uniref:HEAT repeat domain-containing protein n=1 Tax=Pantoea piersonii TaxID=2364647 RepID=UPI002896E561|nr:HEAT repeat domain-containing protein [Pantoea piersonii]